MSRTIRITIEIGDDAAPAVTVERTPQQEPPEALARAAAAIGAISAGPAPAEADTAAQLGQGLAGTVQARSAGEEDLSAKRRERTRGDADR